GKAEVPVGIAGEHVAGLEPRAEHRLARPVRPIPVVRRSRRALDEEMADDAGRHVSPVVIHDPRLEARHDFAHGAALHAAGARRGSMSSGTSREQAPTPAGKYSVFPRPNAKYIFDAEKTTSGASRPNTAAPTRSAAARKCACEWTAAFGRPVDPEV